jgi:electron transfer flavoprotein alpha subunit
MSVLVFLEHNGDQLLRGPLGVLAKAATLGDGTPSAVIVGSHTSGALVSEAGRYGAGRVYVADDEAFDDPLPQPRVDVLERVIRDFHYDTVLFSNSVLAGDVAAGLAARLDAGLNWDLVDLEGRDGTLIGTRSAFQDTERVAVGWSSDVRIALFRSGSFEPTGATAAEPEVQPVSVELSEHSRSSRLVSKGSVTAEASGVEDADVVVAGGMGLGSPESFSLAEGLAAALGGAVGATRAAVYAGWYPRSAQIGQTGKTVSPKLYFALGISGAIQHKVGMQGSKTVIAINSDPNAPIFDVADLAVQGDVHQIVPRLIELLSKRSQS